MFVILCYDIAIKRNTKVKKIARKYLRPVQKSVCEGFISEGNLKRLCSQIKNAIEPEDDSVVIYMIKNNSSTEKMRIGQIKDTDDLIL